MSTFDVAATGSQTSTVQARTVGDRNAARGSNRAVGAINPLLTAFGVLMVVALAGTMIGLVADCREIAGAPAWMKPARFALSISHYSFPLVWLLSLLEGRRRLAWLAGGVTALALLGEMVLLVLQVLERFEALRTAD